jgi:hypothetical protein
MGGEFMDEHAEVKKKRSRWVKAAIWLAGSVIFLVVAVLVTATVYDAYLRHEAQTLAKLPLRERNLAVFDAACELLESHYYNPSVFETDTWREYRKHWRAKAATEPALLLYPNVLGNFGARFLDSHVGFEAPATAPTATAPAQPKSAAQPLRKDDQAAWKRHFDILLSGPGFDVVTIRRGRLGAAIVDDVRRGSAAERAGITPGWAMPFSSTNVDKNGVKFSGTFLELSGDDALTMERTGHPPGVESAGPRDPYTLAHGVRHEYEPDLSPVRDTFELRRLAGNVTYLRFDSFQGGDMTSAFDAIDTAGPEGIIIDLRHNSGGLMLQLQRFLGRLLGNDVEIGSLRSRDSTSRMRTWRWGSVYQGPVIVLIGPQSMSAAEIAAAAVQDHKRGLLLGRMTNGSVLNSRKYPLPDGGTMVVPVRDYHRTGNRRIEGVGVEPDVRVMPTLEDVRAGRDAALERALELMPSVRSARAAALNRSH